MTLQAEAQGHAAGRDTGHMQGARLVPFPLGLAPPPVRCSTFNICDVGIRCQNTGNVAMKTMSNAINCSKFICKISSTVSVGLLCTAEEPALMVLGSGACWDGALP